MESAEIAVLSVHSDKVRVEIAHAETNHFKATIAFSTDLIVRSAIAACQSRHKPGIYGALDPVRNGHGSNVLTLADQIDDGPVILPPLEMSNVEFCRSFRRSPQPIGCRGAPSLVCP